MWGKIKSFVDWILALVFTWLTELMNAIQLEVLQKVFYVLSITLLMIAMIKLIKGKKMGVEKVIQAPSVINQANHIEEKANLIYKILKKIKKGVIQMLEKVKAFGVTRLVTIVLEVIFFSLAVLSAFVPELIWVQENILWLFGAMGLTGVTGAWAEGKELGEKAKVKMEKKKRLADIKVENKKLNAELKQLDLDYSYLNPFTDRIALYGGELSPEHKAAKDTHDKQRLAILDKLSNNKTESKEIIEFLKKENEEEVVNEGE